MWFAVTVLRAGAPARWIATALLLFTASAVLQAQAPAKPRLFDDDPRAGTPNQSNQPKAPANGMVTGLIATIHDGPTLDAPVAQTTLVPYLGLLFGGPPTDGYLPKSLEFHGVLYVAPGGLRGKFSLECNGDSNVMIDNQVVCTVRVLAPAQNADNAVNLAAGLHPFSATCFHLHSDGRAQEILFFWYPADGGKKQKVPTEWLWHATADEPAGAAQIAIHNRKTYEGNGPVRPDLDWVPAGITRAVAPTEQPADLLPLIMMEQYGPENFARFLSWRLGHILGVTIQGTRDNMSWPLSFRIFGVVQVPQECNCSFDVPNANAELVITVDDRVVTRSGFRGEQPMRNAATLTPGNHVVLMTMSRVIVNSGRNALDLKWSSNNAPFNLIPEDLQFHYRSQEDNAGVPAPANPAPNTPASPPPPAPPPPAVVRASRSPVPDADAQARSVAQMRQRFPGGWVDAGGAQQADYLIKASDQTRDDAVASFVLLQRAWQQAQAANSLPLAFAAIDLLAAQFTIDSVRIKLTVLQALCARRAPDLSDTAAAIRIFNQAMSENNYSAACDAAALALAMARQRNMPVEIAEATRLSARAGAASADFERIKPMLARAAADPHDAEANLSVGRFYCFTARNWQRGCAALALCNDPILSWLARHESAALQGNGAPLAVANGWWDAADGQSGAAAAVMRERAAQWYRVAVPTLTGLSRRVAERRLAKTPAAATLASPFSMPIPSGETFGK